MELSEFDRNRDECVMELRVQYLIVQRHFILREEINLLRSDVNVKILMSSTVTDKQLLSEDGEEVNRHQSG